MTDVDLLPMSYGLTEVTVYDQIAEKKACVTTIYEMDREILLGEIRSGTTYIATEILNLKGKRTVREHYCEHPELKFSVNPLLLPTDIESLHQEKQAREEKAEAERKKLEQEKQEAQEANEQSPEKEPEGVQRSVEEEETIGEFDEKPEGEVLKTYDMEKKRVRRGTFDPYMLFNNFDRVQDSLEELYREGQIADYFYAVLYHRRAVKNRYYIVSPFEAMIFGTPLVISLDKVRRAS